MSLKYSDQYVQKLERLIQQDLLPVYERYYTEHNLTPKLDQDLIKQIKHKRELPALLKPKQTP
jgi:hypothetical protein